MKNSKLLPILGILLAILLLDGCTTAYQRTYFNDMAYDTEYPAMPAPALLVRQGDKLDIRVLSTTPELAAPFQLASSATTSGRTATDVYTVDEEGNIYFPLIGVIPVEGMTLVEVQNEVEKRIRQGGYMKSPSVYAHLANFTVTVIGSAGNTVIPVNDDSINLLQVLARIGSPSVRSNTKEVTVLRTEEGVRTAYKVNLHRKELFDSPVFWLQQDDVVYVKPRGAEYAPSTQLAISMFSMGFSMVSMISNIFILANLNK